MSSSVRRHRWRDVLTRISLRPTLPPLETAPAFAAPSSNDWSDRLRRLQRSARRHRRALAATAVALGALIALDVLKPRTPPQSVVIVAARDLPAGATLGAADVRPEALPATAAPDGGFATRAQVVGRRLAAPARRGEPLTDARFDDGPLAPPGRGMVAAPVRLADGDAARLLHPGQHVEVLAASTAVIDGPALASAAADVIAADVVVLSIPPPMNTASTASTAADVTAPGTLVVLATTPDEARALAQAEVSDRLSAVVVG